MHGLKYRDRLELAALDGRLDGAGRRGCDRRRRHRSCRCRSIAAGCGGGASTSRRRWPGGRAARPASRSRRPRSAASADRRSRSASARDRARPECPRRLPRVPEERPRDRRPPRAPRRRRLHHRGDGQGGDTGAASRRRRGRRRSRLRTGCPRRPTDRYSVRTRARETSGNAGFRAAAVQMRSGTSVEDNVAAAERADPRGRGGRRGLCADAGDDDDPRHGPRRGCSARVRSRRRPTVAALPGARRANSASISTSARWRSGSARTQRRQPRAS